MKLQGKSIVVIASTVSFCAQAADGQAGRSKHAGEKENSQALAKDLGTMGSGKKVYGHFCVPCHGEKGDGAGDLATSLPLKPRNFLEEPLRWGNSKESILETVLDGRSDLMPAFRGSISDSDVAHVVDYVWSLLPEKNRGAPISQAELRQAKTHVVGQKNRQFSPERISLKKGSTLLIVNNDDVLHDVKPASSSKKGMTIRKQVPGQWDRYSFPEQGKYEFSCTIHPKMKLVVEVQ